MNLSTLHRKTLCAIAMATGMLPTYAAIVDPYSLLTFEQMQAQAKRDGAVPVTILLKNVNIFADPVTRAADQVDVAKKLALLNAELGVERWVERSTDSLGIGSSRAYLTPVGLDILQKSSNALSFSTDGSWKQTTFLSNTDWSLDAVEKQLIANGFVDAVIIVNVDGLAYTIQPDGRLIFKGDAAQIQDFVVQATKLLDSLLPEEVLVNITTTRQEIEKIRTGQTPFDPHITLRLNLKGIIRVTNSDSLGSLINNPARHIAPKGFLDTTPRYFDQSLLQTAKQNGVAATKLQIRQPLVRSDLSSASQIEQDKALERAMNEILIKADLQGVMKLSEFGDVLGSDLREIIKSPNNLPNDVKTLAWFGTTNSTIHLKYDGSASGNLTVAQLMQLQALNDDRILSIYAPELNTAVATPAGDSTVIDTNITTPPTTPTPEPTPTPNTIKPSSGIATAVDTVFNWAEKTQPAVGLGTPSITVSQTGVGYRFRYYPASNSYLGVNETGIPKVYYLGTLSSQKLLDLGYLTDWLPIAASKIIPAVK